MTSSKSKKSDQHTHDMAQIEGGHVDDRVGAVPGPDSVNRRVSGPGTEPGSVSGLARLKWAMCKWGFRFHFTSILRLNHRAYVSKFLYST